MPKYLRSSTRQLYVANYGHSRSHRWYVPADILTEMQPYLPSNHTLPPAVILYSHQWYIPAYNLPKRA